MAMSGLQLGPTELPLGNVTYVMGVINASPDSKNVHTVAATVDDALLMADRYRSWGATIIDLGGQSSHYDNETIAAADEVSRAVPIIEALVSAVSFKGRKSIRAVEKAEELGADDALVIVDGLRFGDGTIEVDLAGEPAPGSSEGARGFVGIAFRMRPDAKPYEVIYIRPTNGRANDQVRRNHSTQYASHPQYPWHRLRKESPGVYESYADMQPSTWTRVKIVVKDQTAHLYLNGAEQPCLIVNDLKLGSEGGGVALWVGAEAVGYFSNLTVTAD